MGPPEPEAVLLHGQHAGDPAARHTRAEDAGRGQRLSRHGGRHPGLDGVVAELARALVDLGPGPRGGGRQCYRCRVPRQGGQRVARPVDPGAPDGLERQELRVPLGRGPLPRGPAHARLRPRGPGGEGDGGGEALGLQRPGDEPELVQRLGRRAHRLRALLPALRGGGGGGRLRLHVRLQQGQRHARLQQQQPPGARPQGQAGLPRIRADRLGGADVRAAGPLQRPGPGDVRAGEPALPRLHGLALPRRGRVGPPGAGGRGRLGAPRPRGDLPPPPRRGRGGGVRAAGLHLGAPV
mmetsp:Transcript_43441/g.122909  ORF Transcript_43441/g.122909 Transcript_43441/m.122909 type:complete len:295 (+) Transcript_43441:94-978(+)